MTFSLSSSNGERPRRLSGPRRTKPSFKKADWKEYNKAFTKAMESFKAKKGEVSRADRYKRLLKVFDLAAKRLPRGRRMDAMSWWDAEIDTSITKRDGLMEASIESEDGARLCREACKEVNRVICEKKTEAWRKFAGSLSYCSNPKRTASVIKHIGREQPTPESIIMMSADGNKSLKTDEEKAKAFRGVYARVCANDHSVKRTTDRKWKQVKRLRKIKTAKYCNQKTESYENSIACPFSIYELWSALDELQNNKACGDDEVYNEMLKNLNESNLAEVLKVINASWLRGESYSGWNCGTIRPLGFSLENGLSTGILLVD